MRAAISILPGSRKATERKKERMAASRTFRVRAQSPIEELQNGRSLHIREREARRFLAHGAL
jgi:hypothetical protein